MNEKLNYRIYIRHRRQVDFFTEMLREKYISWYDEQFELEYFFVYYPITP